MSSNTGNVRRKCKGTPMKCTSCGCTYHKQRSSKKCPHYRGSEMSRSYTKKGLPTRDDAGAATNNEDAANNNENTANNSASTSIAAIGDASVSYPTFIKVKIRRRCTYEPIVDVASLDFKSQDTMFQVSQRDYHGRCVEVEASPENLIEKYFSDTVIHKIVQASNKYVSK
eukprot:7226604-Ditylum_brightwellii.AAC.1